MIFLSNLRCTTCGKEYSPDKVRYLCPKCSKNYKPGIPLSGVLEVLYDYKLIACAWDSIKDRKPMLLKDILSPVERDFYPDLPVGNTPFFQPQRLSMKYDLPHLYIKFDGLNPSGSLKDRASQLMVAEARRLGIRKIVCASTGNAACSLAALSASSGIQAIIFAPEKAPPAKLVQIRIHGAELHKVKGTYDDAFRAALEFAQDNKVLNRNTGYHPYTIEGKKTAGLEIFVQMQDSKNMNKIPDWIVIPTGDGVILSGVHKAFLDLRRAGITERLPHLLCVQSESSDAITKYWSSGTYEDAASPSTIADSISVKTPSNAHWAVQAIKESAGKCVLVSDDEILAAQKELADYSGIFAEPSSSASLAGLSKAVSQGWINKEESVVLLVTGHGLKDTAAVKF